LDSLPTAVTCGDLISCTYPRFSADSRHKSRPRFVLQGTSELRASTGSRGLPSTIVIHQSVSSPLAVVLPVLRPLSAWLRARIESSRESVTSRVAPPRPARVNGRSFLRNYMKFNLQPELFQEASICARGCCREREIAELTEPGSYRPHGYEGETKTERDRRPHREKRIFLVMQR
jgi:hypothetical protein